MIPIAIFSESLSKENFNEKTIIFEPIKPVTKTFYYCDKKFHIDDIVQIYKNEELEKNKNIKNKSDYWVVFINGDCYSIYQITKSSVYYDYKNLYSESVSLAKRHNKGGQSALRFSRLRDESENNYIKKVAEKTICIVKQNKVNISNDTKLIIVGNADKKNLLEEHELIQSNFKKIYTITVDSISSESTNNLINNPIKKLIGEIEINQANKYIDWINDQIQTNIDTLLFGLNDVIKNINQVKKIYYLETLNIPDLIKSNKIELVPLKNIDQLGIDVIGIKHWANNDDLN